MSADQGSQSPLASRTPTLDAIARDGNRYDPMQIPPRKGGENNITCADGFKLSVVAGWGMYCEPRPGSSRSDVSDRYDGPFWEVEVGFPSERPEPWDEWSQWAESPDDPTGTVYGWVPVEKVRELIESHGGEA